MTFEPDAVRPPEFRRHATPNSAESLPRVRAERQPVVDGARWPQSLDVPLLLGVDTYHFGREGQQCFNSAAYVARDGRLLGRYDKMHLVMFGEYVPFAQYFPWLQRLTPLPISATPGDTAGGVRRWAAFASRRTSATRACCRT